MSDFIKQTAEDVSNLYCHLPLESIANILAYGKDEKTCIGEAKNLFLQLQPHLKTVEKIGDKYLITEVLEVIKEKKIMIQDNTYKIILLNKCDAPDDDYKKSFELYSERGQLIKRINKEKSKGLDEYDEEIIIRQNRVNEIDIELFDELHPILKDKQSSSHKKKDVISEPDKYRLIVVEALKFKILTALKRKKIRPIFDNKKMVIPLHNAEAINLILLIDEKPFSNLKNMNDTTKKLGDRAFWRVSNCKLALHNEVESNKFEEIRKTILAI